MINTILKLNFLVSNKKESIPALLFSIIYLVICYFYIGNYFVWEITSITGVLLLPYIIIIDTDRRGATRFFWVASLFFLAACFTKVTLLYFISIGFAVLFAIETFMGATNYLFIFIWGLLSSAFGYFSNAFGFPIRLEMSKLAGRFLTFAGIENKVLGNIIQINNTEFSVDPACTGLKMMGISLVIAIFLLAYYQRKSGKSLNFVKTIAILTVAILLNIINNQIRIILLIYFCILPDNPMHYIIGLSGLVTYVIIPMYLFVRWMYTKTYKKQAANPTIKVKKWILVLMNLSLVSVIAFMGYTFANKYGQSKAIQPVINLEGYSKTFLHFNVIKLQKTGILIYIKPIDQFYQAEHSPAICWTGSGYKYNNVKNEIVGKVEIYTGVMNMENDTLYTAWWFDNGTDKTIDQMKWRWNMLTKSKAYCLVNVNAGSKPELMDEVKNLLSKNIFTTE
jgi:exosortase N